MPTAEPMTQGDNNLHGVLRSILAILLSVGLLAVAGIAVFGAPGLSPGFKRTNKGPATPVRFREGLYFILHASCWVSTGGTGITQHLV